MHGRLIHGTEKPVLSFVERSLLRSTDIQYPATCRGAIDAETLTPVSYTHLDVYKRQDDELEPPAPREVPVLWNRAQSSEDERGLVLRFPPRPREPE